MLAAYFPITITLNYNSNKGMTSFFIAVKYAAIGIYTFFIQERNAKIQFFIAILTLFLSWWLHISNIEWILVLLCMMLVIGLEMMNTAIEKICNHITPNFHPNIKIIKDIAAGAVLWAACCSVIIGCIIFIPKITHYIFNWE